MGSGFTQRFWGLGFRAYWLQGFKGYGFRLFDLNGFKV